MRMTVSLDDDVARLLDDAARSRRRSKRELVNEALRQALPALAEASAPVERPVELPPPAAPDEVYLGRSDQDAIDTALARYFGLSAPGPRLHVVRND